jgi:ribosomal protein S18 acetylase RimI-like enzyme
MIIEFAKWTDVDQIIKLSNITQDEHAERNPDSFYPSSQSSMLEESIKDQFPMNWRLQRNDSNSILVCRIGDEVVGYLFFSFGSSSDGRRAYYIVDITVQKAYRKKGAGQTLIDELKQIAISRNVESISASVWDGNLASENLFDKVNFTYQKPQYKVFNFDI